MLADVLAAVSAKAPEDRGPAVREMRFSRRDGCPIWARVSAVALHLPQHPVSTLLQVEDITARREAERRIAHMARHDALTDLPNRTLFRERLDALLRQGAGAILWLDLDRFKVVNDTLGHAAGDMLLCEVARRMQAVLAPDDTIARLGGDEFAVLLCGDDPLAASQAAGRLIEAMQAPVVVAGRPMHVGVSIGVVLAPCHGHDADTLMARADRALYSAKAAGRSTFRLYDPGMDSAVAEQHGLELDLRLGWSGANSRCIPADRHGGRAPRRLPRGPGALAPPDPRAGAAGRLHPARRGDRPDRPPRHLDPAPGLPRRGDLGRRHRVAVNVSAAQVKHGPLIAAVQSACARSGLAADRLEIEITESLLIEGDAADLLLALRRLGCASRSTISAPGTRP